MMVMITSTRGTMGAVRGLKARSVAALSRPCQAPGPRYGNRGAVPDRRHELTKYPVRSAEDTSLMLLPRGCRRVLTIKPYEM